jgi:L,D-transpeptidase YcbB
MNAHLLKPVPGNHDAGESRPMEIKFYRMRLSFVLPAVIAVFLMACGDDARDKNGQAGKPREIKFPRNLSITPQNAYSDLFLDSVSLEKFIDNQKMSDTVANYFRLFYSDRNFQFAWFSSDGVTEQTLSFRSLYDYDKDSTVSRKSLDNTLDDILTQDSLTRISPDARIVKTELMLTWRFINYITDKYEKERTAGKALVQLIPSKKSQPLELAEYVLSGKGDERRALSPDYQALKKALSDYVAKAKSGGFPAVEPIKKQLSKGKNAAIVKAIKLRLASEGLYPANDTTDTFGDELESVVKLSQGQYGLPVNGKITPGWISELNVPVESRIEQILINLERMKWMPATTEGKMIVVNIPEFKLHVREASKEVFDMDIVVGKEGSNTINFSGMLNQVVFNPYWNVPRSIVTKEVLPGMEKNTYYLEEHQMEITGEEDGLPVVRQLPGDHNSLGRVKFLFPNTFNIYFHDTPEKELFKRTKRAYSHGCIRLSEPMKMAEYLIGDNTDWPREKIDSLLSTDVEKYIRVKQPVPVLIAYYTTWVNHVGGVEFRDDIYNHDKKMSRKLFFGQAGQNDKLAKAN